LRYTFDLSGGVIVMAVLIGGKWTDGELAQETSQSGQFQRADSIFRDRITADGSSGFKAEPNRYHLYATSFSLNTSKITIARADPINATSFADPPGCALSNGLPIPSDFFYRASGLLNANLAPLNSHVPSISIA
jgi:hypothetical protein